MTAIPHAAQALTSALDRFELASVRVLGAVTGAEDENLGAALVDLSAAKTQVKASVTVVRFADEMWGALIAIGAEPQPR
jgi:hypothetical protein